MKVRISLSRSNFLKIFIGIVVLFSVIFFISKTYFINLTYLGIIGITSWLIYKMFIFTSKIRISSDLRLFGLRILSAITFVVGFLLTVGAFMAYFQMAIKEIINPIHIGTFLFIGLLGIGLILLGSYMAFRFMLRSGVIIYRR